MVKKDKTRILIFGGTGFIGHHLTKKFVKKGCQVTSVSKRSPTKEKFIKGVEEKDEKSKKLEVKKN